MELNTKTNSLAKVQTHLVAECFNKLYIGGEFVDPIDGDKYPTYYPATGELLDEFPRGKANDVESAIAAANAAWAEGTWAGMAATERAKIVAKMAQGIEDNVPSVGLVRRGVAHLAAYSSEVAGILHQVGEVRPARLLDLVKALHLVVVRVETREHDVSTRHAVAHCDVRVGKAQRL